MLYWLASLSDKVWALNLFRYITVRSGGATITALVFVLVLGPMIIHLLRARQGKGQPIRSDGPRPTCSPRSARPPWAG